ncbi:MULTISPECIES: hypothetical protein [unclassified Streptomyces]|uniref:hypothetical protein n=1 Tax=unclassified Streptomyces TaxID=2593676 RepID=UPI00331F1A39
MAAAEDPEQIFNVEVTYDVRVTDLPALMRYAAMSGTDTQDVTDAHSAVFEVIQEDSLRGVDGGYALVDGAGGEIPGLEFASGKVYGGGPTVAVGEGPGAEIEPSPQEVMHRLMDQVGRDAFNGLVKDVLDAGGPSLLEEADRYAAEGRAFDPADGMRRLFNEIGAEAGLQSPATWLAHHWGIDGVEPDAWASIFETDPGMTYLYVHNCHQSPMLYGSPFVLTPDTTDDDGDGEAVGIEVSVEILDPRFEDGRASVMLGGERCDGGLALWLLSCLDESRRNRAHWEHGGA